MANRVKLLLLSDSDRGSVLAFMKDTCSKREYRRAQSVLMKADGYTYEAVAERLGVSSKSVERWIHARSHLEGKAVWSRCWVTVTKPSSQDAPPARQRAHL